MYENITLNRETIPLINESPSSTRAGVCRNLKSIVVQIGIEDYFEDPNSPEARKLFDEMVNKLQVTAALCLTLSDVHVSQHRNCTSVVIYMYT